MIFPLSFEADRLYEKVKGVAIQYVPLSGTPNADFLKFKTEKFTQLIFMPNILKPVMMYHLMKSLTLK